MKKSSRIFLVSLILLLVLGSCTTFKMSGVQVTKALPAYNTVGTFDINVKVFEFLGSPGGANLGNVTSDVMDEKIYDAIQREISKYSGDAAVNVVVEYKADLVDMLIAGFTGSIVAPATAYLSGTIIKYN